MGSGEDGKGRLGLVVEEEVEAFGGLSFVFQMTSPHILFNIVMQSITSPVYSFIFTLFSMPPQNLLFPMDHIPVYDTHSLHCMKSIFVTSQYCVQNDIKLGSRPVLSS